MNAEVSLNSILLKIKKLSKTEQITLLQKISLLIQPEINNANPANLMDISGLGSKLWKNTDIDKYVDSERQW